MSAQKRRVTLKDVAEAAGVSVKTASNVKNDWPYVSDDTRQKVKAAMRDLGYRPSNIARSLKLGRSETIGVIVPDISNPFFSTAYRGIEDALAPANYSSFLCNTDENPDREAYYLDLLINQGVDGILLWGSCLRDDRLRELIPGDIDFVSIDGTAEERFDNFTSIKVENYAGAEKAVSHLIAGGRRRIAYLAGATHRLPAIERLNGYRAALEAAGIPFDPALVIEGSPSIGGGFNLGERLFAAEKPDAVFCYNDLIAIGAMNAAAEAGLSIPDDVAFIGFDDIPSASLITPLLSTVHIPQYELGIRAADLILQRIKEEKSDYEEFDHPVRLIIRESCGTRVLDSVEKLGVLRGLAQSGKMNIPETFTSKEETTRNDD